MVIHRDNTSLHVISLRKLFLNREWQNKIIRHCGGVFLPRHEVCKLDKITVYALPPSFNKDIVTVSDTSPSDTRTDRFVAPKAEEAIERVVE